MSGDVTWISSTDLDCFLVEEVEISDCLAVISVLNGVHILDHINLPHRLRVDLRQSYLQIPEGHIFINLHQSWLLLVYFVTCDRILHFKT